MTPMPWIAPLFVEDQNFMSTLVLVNPTPADRPAEITLRNAQVAMIAQHTVTVKPRSDLRVPVESLLRAAGATDTTGSISVMPTAANVAAQLSLTYRAQPTASYIDEELGRPMPDSSPTLRGVVDNAHGSPIVAITSAASVLEHITVRCLSQVGRPLSKTLDLAPNATALAQPCNNVPLGGDIETMIAAIPDDSGGAFGIELTSDGPPGGFSAFGLAAHRADNLNYFSALSFVDPRTLHSSSTVYAGVPVGPSTLLPSGTYMPELALANFGMTDAHVKVSLSTTIGGRVKSGVLATVLVPTGGSVMLTLSTAAASPQLQNSFVLTSDAAPGAVMSKLVATSDGPLHEEELLGKDAQDPMNGDQHPWSVGGGTEATILLFDHGANVEDVQVSIGYPGGVWRKKYRIKSVATLAISIQGLVEQQVPDDEGHLLPGTLNEGAVLWATRRGAVTGRLLQSNSGTAMARSFSCGIYDYLGNPASAGGNLAGPVNGNFNFSSAVATEWTSDGSLCDFAGNYMGPWSQWVAYLWRDFGPSNSLSPSSSTGDQYAFTATTAGVETVDVTLTDINGCGAEAQATATVTPVISQNQNLWWFGSGNAPASGFNLGGITATLTASGAGNGTYVWTVTNGTSKLQFENNSTTITKSNTNQVGIQSIFYSTASNDVTVQLQFTPSAGGGAVTTSFSLGIDSPYKLSSTGTTTTTGAIINCNSVPEPSGSDGFQSLVPYEIRSFFGVRIANIGINENFANQADDYIGNQWPPFSAGGFTTTDGLFVDNICAIGQTTLVSLPPQSPLSTVKIDHASQTWFVGGSTTPAAGVEVQSNILQRYQDHGLHTTVVSPVR